MVNDLPQERAIALDKNPATIQPGTCRGITPVRADDQGTSKASGEHLASQPPLPLNLGGDGVGGEVQCCFTSTETVRTISDGGGEWGGWWAGGRGEGGGVVAGWPLPRLSLQLLSSDQS